ncbi:MAG: trypsin-like peptidase domain-containing protein [Corynebacterium nuruki]|jgi:putative serine protease PepD|nr:trypsin-like peptidase domain-containing protein [Corynebacterium nuruki]
MPDNGSFGNEYGDQRRGGWGGPRGPQPQGQPGQYGPQGPLQPPQGQQGQQPPQGPGQQSPQGPQGLQGPQPAGRPAPAQQAKRRFSTPAVASMVVAVGVVASALTSVIWNSVDDGNGSGSSGAAFSTTVVGDKQQASDNKPSDGSVESVAQKVLPSVVSIQVQSSRGEAEGSGSIISSDGLIVTNNHVVEGAGDGGSNLLVRTNDNQNLKAKVVATDPSTDIAVIKADGGQNLTPITIGDPSSLKVGQSVVAVGSPLGLQSTVTQGIVSAQNRPVQATGESGGEGSLIDAIQTDAAINPGNSGGALVNLNGELIGIPSVIATLGGGQQESGSIGLGFAIPANQAMDTAKQLIDNGKASHPIIDAQVDTRDTSVAGALIAEVGQGGPADKAGLKGGQVVTKVDDRVVDTGVSLIAGIRSHKVGDEVTLTVTDKDGGNPHEVKVTLTASE